MADASTTKDTTGKAVGATTKGAATGAGLAGAAATIVMYVLAKTGVEQDPAVAGVLAGALVTLLSGVGALIGGKLSPTNQGDALFAQQAVDQVDQMVARLAAAQAVGPAQYAPTAGEQPVTEPTSDEEPSVGFAAGGVVHAGDVVAESYSDGASTIAEGEHVMTRPDGSISGIWVSQDAPEPDAPADDTEAAAPSSVEQARAALQARYQQG